jgi:hypothetical protein
LAFQGQILNRVSVRYQNARHICMLDLSFHPGSKPKPMMAQWSPQRILRSASILRQNVNEMQIIAVEKHCEDCFLCWMGRALSFVNVLRTECPHPTNVIGVEQPRLVSSKRTMKV